VAFQGLNGSHNEPRPVLPPLSNKCDIEIDPTELNFSTSTIIGKARHNIFVKFVAMFQCTSSTFISSMIRPNLPSGTRLGRLQVFFHFMEMQSLSFNK
jgi:hypothetical protein